MKFFLSYMYIKIVCRPGYYGNGCGHLCNGYCMNNEVCTHVDGVCLAGCQDGYIGQYCSICKKMINNYFFCYQFSTPLIWNIFILIYDPVFIKLAMKATLVKAVPPFVHHIVKHVDTQTDIVVVPLVIQDIDVPQVNTVMVYFL